MKKRTARSQVIRGGKPSDFPGIVQCYWRNPEVPWDPYAHVDTLKNIVGPKGFLVAEYQGKIVAFLHYRIFHNHPWFDPRVQHYGQILELHVRPGFRAKGIGRQLMAEALRRLDRVHCRAIYVHTDEDNRPALLLYRGLGFKPIHRTFFLKRTT